MSEIRTTYSGLLTMIMGLSSIVLGLMFVLIITRTLSSEDYGTWGLISGLFVYGLIFDHVFTFWAVRNSARGIESNRTSIISSALFSTFGVVIYIIATFVVVNEVESNTDVVFFGAILIPLIFVNRVLTSIVSGWKPHLAAFGMLVFTSFEFLAALIFVYFLTMNVIGIIISVVIAYVISNSLLLFSIRNKIKHKFQFHFLKNWLKLSWLPMYPTIGNSLLLIDITIFTVITGSVVGISFWSAAMVISKLVESSGSFSGPVYAKLLQEDNHSYVSENLNYFIYFGILFTALSITFAKPGLFILNPIYEIASPIVIILSVKIFFQTLTSINLTFLMGKEKVDIKHNVSFNDYLKSKLFYVPTFLLINSVSYVVILAIVLVIFVDIVESDVDLLYYWALVALLVQLPFSIFIFYYLMKNYKISINYSSIAKYMISSIGIFTLIYFIMEKHLIYENDLFIFIFTILPLILAGIGAYVLITSLIDPNIRNLVKGIFKEINLKK